MIVGKNFYDILYSEILNGIAKASNSLAVDLMDNERNYSLKVHKELMEDMKKAINDYIENQLIAYEKITNDS